MKGEIRCIIVDDEHMARDVLKRHLDKIDSIHIVAMCKNALEAFKVINREPVDIIFLDIKMPDISGLTFAKSINKDVKIIFTTAFRDYALDGFELQAVDYLLKPISFERLLRSIQKFLNENKPVQPAMQDDEQVEKANFIFVRSDRKMVRIDFDEIQYIESLSDYIKIILGNKTVITREAISNIEARLPKKQFIRVHRSFIISCARIISFTNEFIEVGDQEIPISRSYKQEVLDRLNHMAF